MSGAQFIQRVSIAAFLLLVPAASLRAQEANSGDTEARKLYETAFTALVEGHYDKASAQLDKIIANYPGSLYATFAAKRKRRLEGLDLYRLEGKDIDQRGRINALIFGTLYSTWLGVGTAIVTGADSDRALAAGMMIGAPVGLITTQALTRNTALSPGQAGLIKLGGLWGTWQGFGWMVVAGEEKGRRLTGAAMAGGLLGIASSAALTRHTDLSRGDAALLNYAGLWGTWFGFCASVMAEVDDDNAMLSNTLLGGDLGLLAMAALVPRVEMSPMRARLVNLGGLTGTFVASGIVGLLAMNGAFDDGTVPMGMVMAGGIAGLWAGVVRTRDYDTQSSVSNQRSSRAALAISGETIEWGWPAPALRISTPAIPRRLRGVRPSDHSMEIHATLVDIRF